MGPRRWRRGSLSRRSGRFPPSVSAEAILHFVKRPVLEPAVAGSITEVTDNNSTAEVLENDKPVLVDFWAPWCGPCRVIAPSLEEIAEENDDLRIVKLNVDDNQNTAARYQVMSIPPLILFKGGEPIHQIIGAMPKSRLVQEIEPALAA